MSKYFSIESEVSAGLVAKGSKFIANAAPVAEKEEAEKYISTISARFKEATHNCFAYKTGIADQALFRFSDDGEPSGTAGRPILQAIETKDLTNIALVVSRYFGGTKLGTGGLIRAYNSAALEALNKAKIVAKYPQIILRLKFPYEYTNAAQHLINKFGGNILETQFDEQTVYRVQLKASDEMDFRNELQNATSGRVIVERVS